MSASVSGVVNNKAVFFFLFHSRQPQRYMLFDRFIQPHTILLFGVVFFFVYREEQKKTYRKGRLCDNLNVWHLDDHPILGSISLPP